MPSLSVVIPATDRPATLPRCLGPIERSAPAAEEVLVVDGPAGLSGPAARNDGARRAGGDVLVFVDADVEIAPDALGRIRALFAADPGLTAAFGSYDDVPSRGGAVAAFPNLLHHHVHQGAAGPAETFWSGLGAVRRDAFLAAGGFDAERFPHPSVEDIDLGVRLVARGGRILLDPAVQGTHLKAWTLRSMVVTDVARRGIPWVALQLRTGRVSTALNLGWRHRISAAVTAVGALALVRGRPRPVALAVLGLVGLNREFYALLARRRGWREAVLGVGLHAVHHLCAVVSVPAGVLVHLRERRAARRDGSAPHDPTVAQPRAQREPAVARLHHPDSQPRAQLHHPDSQPRAQLHHPDSQPRAQLHHPDSQTRAQRGFAQLVVAGHGAGGARIPDRRADRWRLGGWHTVAQRAGRWRTVAGRLAGVPRIGGTR